jgi:outer membrane protein assembly factor BamB
MGTRGYSTYASRAKAFCASKGDARRSPWFNCTCVNNDGTPRWHADFKWGQPAAVCTDENDNTYVTFGYWLTGPDICRIDSQGHVTAMGHLGMWSYRIRYHDGLLYLLSQVDKQLYRVDPATLIVVDNYSSTINACSLSEVASTGDILAQHGRGTESDMHRFTLYTNTGTRIWGNAWDDPVGGVVGSYVEPLFGGDGHIYTAGGFTTGYHPGVWIISRADGSVLDSASLSFAYRRSSSVLLWTPGNPVVSGNGHGWQLARAPLSEIPSGDLDWSITWNTNSEPGRLLLHDGDLYVCHTNTSYDDINFLLGRFDLATGTEQWLYKERISAWKDNGYSANDMAAISDGVVIVHQRMRRVWV